MEENERGKWKQKFQEVGREVCFVSRLRYDVSSSLERIHAAVCLWSRPDSLPWALQLCVKVVLRAAVGVRFDSFVSREARNMEVS